jgi:hypothetical protein
MIEISSFAKSCAEAGLDDVVKDSQTIDGGWWASDDSCMIEEVTSVLLESEG